MKDYIISIIYKNNDEIKILSKINFNNSLKINNQKFSKIDLDVEKDFNLILSNLKNIYEDEWKKNNEINTSIKLPLTISIKSKNYKKIMRLEDALTDIDLLSSFYILNFDMNNKNFNLVMEDNIWTIK